MRLRIETDGGATCRYLSSGSPDNGRSAALDKSFDELVTPSRGDTHDTLSAETTQEYIESLGVKMDNAELFVVMELIQAPSLGEMTRKGFVNGWKNTDLTNFSKLAQKNYIRNQIARLSSDPDYFKSVYRHAFIAGKESNVKSLDLKDAIVFWQLLFSPPGRPWKTENRDWFALWEQFLTAKWTRSVNKDMWNMTLEFANKTMHDEALTFYNEEDSWPAVIDEFVAWYRKSDAMDLN